jgi:hypothetical protein
MLPRNENQSRRDQEQEKGKPDPAANSNGQENVRAAHETAEDDIQQDPDFSVHSPNDDLDEGEIARLGEDKNDLA